MRCCKYAELITDELNVKAGARLERRGRSGVLRLNPLPKQLGQKYGSRFPAIRKALLALDAEPAAQTLLAGAPLPVEVNGEMVSVLPEEVEVRAQARAGFAVASEGAYLAALVTELTPELVQRRPGARIRAPGAGSAQDRRTGYRGSHHGHVYPHAWVG